MDEAKRFLRYAIPGLVFVTEVILYLYISNGDPVIGFVKQFLLDNKTSGTIILFLALIPIGFLFSIVHHILFNLYLTSLYPASDHRDMIIHSAITDRLWLRIRGPLIGPISPRGAWRIAASIWHERKECSNRINGANPRAESLADLMHGSGATAVGALFAFITWAFLFQRYSKCPFRLYFLLVPLTILLIHLINYRRTVEHYQGFTEIIMLDELRHERFRSGWPAVVIISMRELEPQWISDLRRHFQQ